MLAERAVKNATEVEKAYGALISGKHFSCWSCMELALILSSSGDEGEDWGGVSASSSLEKGKGKAREHAEEYEDEEQLATVTVVEDFDPDTLLHGPPIGRPTRDEAEQGASPTTPSVLPETKTAAKKTSTDIKKSQSKTTAKAKTIKYQTNAARKAERSKQQRRKSEKAQRAGGKSARRSKNVRGKR